LPFSGFFVISFRACRPVFLVLLFGLAGCPHHEPPPVPVEVTEKTPCAGLVTAGFPLYAMPQAADAFVCHEGYALEYNPRSKTPVWVVEHLTRENLATREAFRDEDFRPDPLLDAETAASLNDFRGSGYDRGHMAPAEDFRGSIRQMSESFLLSNMVPQNPDNNRGIWARLEKNVRDWANQRESVYVITGPVFYANAPAGWIGNPAAPVAVPTHLFKIVYDPARRQAVAFLVPNTPQSLAALSGFGVRIADLQAMTGLRFFPGLPPEQVAALDATMGSGGWGIR
jgi:endonuclease G